MKEMNENKKLTALLSKSALKKARRNDKKRLIDQLLGRIPGSAFLW